MGEAEHGSRWEVGWDKLKGQAENKILELEFGSRSEAAGKLTAQQSDCPDHEIQPSLQPTKS